MGIMLGSFDLAIVAGSMVGPMGSKRFGVRLLVSADGGGVGDGAKVSGGTCTTSFTTVGIATVLASSPGTIVPDSSVFISTFGG